MKRFSIIILVICIEACTPSRTVSERQIGDSKLNCIEITERIAELNGLKALYNKEYFGLLDLQGAYTGESSSSGNIGSVNKRKAVLAGYYNDRGCSSDIPEYTIEEIKEKINNNELKELQG